MNYFCVLKYCIKINAQSCLKIHLLNHVARWTLPYPPCATNYASSRFNISLKMMSPIVMFYFMGQQELASLFRRYTSQLAKGQNGLVIYSPSRSDGIEILRRSRFRSFLLWLTFFGYSGGITGKCARAFVNKCPYPKMAMPHEFSGVEILPFLPVSYVFPHCSFISGSNEDGHHK